MKEKNCPTRRAADGGQAAVLRGQIRVPVAANANRWAALEMSEQDDAWSAWFEAAWRYREDVAYRHLFVELGRATT